MTSIRTLIHGITGRMGQETLRAITAAPDIEPVGGVGLDIPGDTMALPDSDERIPVAELIAPILQATNPQVVVDFSNAEAAVTAARMSLSEGAHFVTGTSGIADSELAELDALAKDNDAGLFVAPNFALGAVILQTLVARAAPHFDFIDIIEAHHEAKIDAPSGTAIAIANAARQARETDAQRNRPQRENLASPMGAELGGIGVHSIRQPGRSAHHEVVMGAQGQTLTLRHDTLSRDCYMPGVLLAIRRVVNIRGLVLGLDKLLEE